MSEEFSNQGEKPLKPSKEEREQKWSAVVRRALSVSAVRDFGYVGQQPALSSEQKTAARAADIAAISGIDPAKLNNSAGYGQEYPSIH
jgi:hypothetical protein